jgi:hypothetical protein
LGAASMAIRNCVVMRMEREPCPEGVPVMV